MKTSTKILLLSALALTLTGFKASAAPSQKPLFLGTSAPPLMMLVMQRDHKLYYEAYNDASDLDGDGIPETNFKPSMEYLGYFDSKTCYNYVTSNKRFEPSTKTANMECANAWSGNFLNYLTTSRIDALRRVLYGGYRSTDTTTETVLERAHIPQDAHSWGKEYTSIAANGYDITKYAPLAKPTTGKQHLFANLTPYGTTAPLLRLRENSGNRVWEWLSKERPVGGDTCDTPSDGIKACTGTLTDYTVRVKACVSGVLDGVCTKYSGGGYKPTGLLQKYGENESMHFGLLTGSYANNKSGGVLRKNVGLFTDEIDTGTGQFKLLNDNDSAIVNTVNRLRTTGFTMKTAGDPTTLEYTCGWIADKPLPNGQCQMWGNPVGEMMYETVRYFAGASATSQYLASQNAGEESTLKLPVASWKDPYKEKSQGGGGAKYCAKPFMLTISDIYPSYDSDELPGVDSNFAAGFSGSLSGLKVGTEVDKIWSLEGLGGSKYFIGQSGGTKDGAPTAKNVAGFSSIRGLAPEEPTKEGSYYSAGVARWARINDVNTVQGEQKVQTFVVAMASPLPKVRIPTGSGAITIIPFAKSVSGYGTEGAFKPTNQLVDFYIEEIKNTDSSNQDANVNGGRPQYKFRINYEDVEQGADHDMDAIVTYTVKLDTNKDVIVSLSSDYAAGGIVQHMGYVVSGSTADGVYLVVRDKDTGESSDVNYALDVPQHPGSALPLTSTRKFSAGSSTATFIPHDPLWYAAKHGGFKDDNNNNQIDAQADWDDDKDGTPDNYYLVSNPAKLFTELDKAFNEVVKRAGSASMLSLNSRQLTSDTLVYQASFNAADWSGEVKALKLGAKAAVGATAWTAASQIPAAGSRKIFTWKMNKIAPASAYSATGTNFEYANLDDDQKTRLGQAPTFPAPVTTTNQQNLVAYIRGDKTNEGVSYRKRDVLLGDIVNSDPTYGGSVDFGYDSLPTSAGGGSSYLSYLYAKKQGDQTLYVGANDGMLHAFDAKTGSERFAFIPDGVINNLKYLADPTYPANHKYFVDGPLSYSDVYLGGAWKSYLVGSTGAGGRSLFALDVTNAAGFTSSNVKWEFTHADLGYTLSRPVVARMANGRWAAITGNGPDSSSGTSKIFIVYLDPSLSDANGWDAGSDYCVLTADTTTANGMGSPTVIMSESGAAEYIYAGDLQGRMWRFNVADSSGNCPSAWKPHELFKAINASNKTQPITAAPTVGLGPNDGVMVVFGTGKFSTATDPTDMTTQSLYGVLDELGSSPKLTRSHLVEQTITRQTTTSFSNDETKASYTEDIRETSSNVVDFTSKKGWYLDLVDMTGGTAAQKGERVIAAPQIRWGNAIFTTFVPSNDPCSAGGESWVFAMSLTSGRRDDTYFDLNRSGTFNHDDNYNGGSKATTAIRFGIGGPPVFTNDLKDGKSYMLKPSDGNINNPCKAGQDCRLEVLAPPPVAAWRQIK